MDLPTLVSQANLAPSVHNTQPTRWHLQGDALDLSIDPTRRLSVGDPTGADARLSLGAALEGTVMALSAQNYKARGVELAQGDVAAQVSVVKGTGDAPDTDAALVGQRLTWRGGFGPRIDLSPLAEALSYRDDATLVAPGKTMEALAELNDTASLTIMRDAAFRRELLHWMRLPSYHPEIARDGLSREALGMSKVEALGASIVLRRPMFDVLDLIGMGKTLTAERPKTLAASGVVLFHRPVGEDRVRSGRAYYRVLLILARFGLAGWPMAALSDECSARREVARMFDLPDNRHLILAVRFGPVPKGVQPPAKARLPVNELIL